jgi:hypothetical protein
MGELTFKSARKMRAIEQAAADAQGRIAAMIDKRRSLENDAQIIEAEMKRREPDQRAEHDKALTAIAKEISEWNDEMKRRQERLVNDCAVRNHCAEFIRLVPLNAELVDVSLPIIGAEVGELQGIRAEIVAVKREAVELASAPSASAELKAMVRDYVERMASRHTPRIRVAGGGMYVDWQSVDVLGVPEAPFGVFCYLAPKLAMERLTADVLELSGYAAGVPEAERQRCDAALQRKLSDLEMREEQMVEELLSSGVDVVRRHDASPAAILGVVVRRGAAAA